MKRAFLIVCVSLTLVGCFSRRPQFDQPPGTLLLEFSHSIRYVLDLEIDGKPVPIEYTGKNRLLLIEGLKPGAHHFNLHSISYVFGPEYERFEIKDGSMVHFFVQSRKYRLGAPKKKEQVSIRAYRKSLREAKEASSQVRARFI